MKHDLGFILPVLDNTIEHNYICQTIKHLIIANPTKQICIFNDFCQKIDTMNIPLLSIEQGIYFHGNIFVFDILSLFIANSFVQKNNIYYYAEHIPWSKHNTDNNYQNWFDLFGNSSTKIISKNQFIHDIFNIAWNNSLGIAETFNYDKISKLL